jgi:NADH-quinone oxidoreductase subunit J
MSVGNVFFCLCSLVALVGAVGTVVAKNPIRSAVGLLTTIFGIAGLFLQLNAQFLAAIQLIVYAGAVVVLFVFVIMLLGPDATTTVGSESAAPRALWSRRLGAALLIILAAACGLLAASVNPAPVKFSQVPLGFGGVESVGQLLFTTGLVPFELATALLIVSVVGAIAVARSRHGTGERKPVVNPQRLFTGAVHPRDATAHVVAKEGVS